MQHTGRYDPESVGSLSLSGQWGHKDCTGELILIQASKVASPPIVRYKDIFKDWNSSYGDQNLGILNFWKKSGIKNIMSMHHPNNLVGLSCVYTAINSNSNHGDIVWLK